MPWAHWCRVTPGPRFAAIALSMRAVDVGVGSTVPGRMPANHLSLLTTTRVWASCNGSIILRNTVKSSSSVVFAVICGRKRSRTAAQSIFFARKKG